MLKRFIALTFALCLYGGPAGANELATVKQNLAARFPGEPITSVAKTPLKGLYEAVIGGHMLYTDEKAEYIFIGNLIDAKTRRNLTQERMREVFRVNFDKLPLEDAIKTVSGNGKRKMVVFSDPDCPYCKILEKTLQSVSNVTVYTFLYPLEGLHPGASKKAREIWCAPDRTQAWHNHMIKGIEPKDAGSCSNPVAKNAKLGRALGVTSTPTIIFANGRMVSGVIPERQLNELLDSEVRKKTPRP